MLALKVQHVAASLVSRMKARPFKIPFALVLLLLAVSSDTGLSCLEALGLDCCASASTDLFLLFLFLSRDRVGAGETVWRLARPVQWRRARPCGGVVTVFIRPKPNGERC